MLSKILKQYEEKCGKFTIDFDKDCKTYIYTERFTAEPLSTDKNQFQDFPIEFQKLHECVFSDTNVMEKFATGKVKSEQEFEQTVALQSLRWSHGYPFAGFIVTETDTDTVVGYEQIGNSNKQNTGEVAYLFSTYKRSDTKKYVGLENVGALILGYGMELAKKQALVNQLYDDKSDTFTEGTVFSKAYATARTDNIGSQKILEYLGFAKTDIVNKYGHQRHEFELDYTDLSGDGMTVIVNGLT